MIPTVDNTFEKIIIENKLRKNIGVNQIVTFISTKLGYSEVTYYNDNNFIVVKNFSVSKNIQNKGIEFNEGSPIGIWYHFDEEGKLIKEENTDEGYQFLAADVIRYCERHKI